MFSILVNQRQTQHVQINSRFGKTSSVTFLIYPLLVAIRNSSIIVRFLGEKLGRHRVND